MPKRKKADKEKLFYPRNENILSSPSGEFHLAECSI
jgi:hypothetical protein